MMFLGLITLAVLLFAVVAAIMYRALRPRVRGVAGKRDPNYAGVELSADPLVEHFARHWQPGQLSPELSAKISRGNYAELSSEEYWEVLLSTRTPPEALDGL